MPPIDLQTAAACRTAWSPAGAAVPNARAYYLHAMGHCGNDMVMWSSAETADTGMGLFDYLPNATIDRWVKDRVLAQARDHAVCRPQGHLRRAGRPGAATAPMLRMIAYGGESNFAYPPRPTTRAAWEPEWAVRVRVKSHTMAMLGEEPGGRGSAGRSHADRARRSSGDIAAQAPAEPSPECGRIGDAAAQSGRGAQGPVRPLRRLACKGKARLAGLSSWGLGVQSEKILPGFMMFLGPSARLMVRIMSTAPAPVSVTRNSILCRPTPCSPVQVPSMLSARITS